MTLNVTIHPFDEREYVGLVVPVVMGRRSPEELLARYATDAEAARLIAAWTPRMSEALQCLRAGDGVPWSTVVNFATAAMNAHVHPAYHLRDLGLTYWRAPSETPFRPYTRSMAILAAQVPELGASVSEVREGFVGAHSAGSYVTAGDVPLFLRDMERRALEFAACLRGAGYDPVEVLWTLCEVLHYARERRLALLEVTEAYVPDTRQALFPVEHLRSAERGNLHPAVGRRVRSLLGLGG